MYIYTFCYGYFTYVINICLHISRECMHVVIIISPYTVGNIQGNIILTIKQYMPSWNGMNAEINWKAFHVREGGAPDHPHLLHNRPMAVRSQLKDFQESYFKPPKQTPKQFFFKLCYTSLVFDFSWIYQGLNSAPHERLKCAIWPTSPVLQNTSSPRAATEPPDTASLARHRVRRSILSLTVPFRANNCLSLFKLSFSLVASILLCVSLCVWFAPF